MAMLLATSEIATRSAGETSLAAAEELRRELPEKSITDRVRVTYAHTGEDEGRCLRASDGISQGDIVMKLPAYTTCITSRSLAKLLASTESKTEGIRENCSKVTCIEDLPPCRYNKVLTPRYKQLLFLLYASSSGASPSRRAYIQTLPKSFSHMPINWTEEQVNRLGPMLAPTLKNFCARLTSEIELAVLDLAPVLSFLVSNRPDIFPKSCLDLFTYEWCLWAYSAMTSRSFDLSQIHTSESSTAEDSDSNSVNDGNGLVPFMDLMNHADSPASATVVVAVERDDDDEGYYVVARAVRDISEGDELCFSYRLQGDALKFLFNYGFVPDDAKDIFYFMVEYPHDDDDDKKGEGEDGAGAHLDDEKKLCDPLLAAALKSLGLPGTRVIAVPLTEEEPLPETWMWALRLRAMHIGDERERFLGNFAKGGQIEMTQAHESSMWSTIAQTLESSLETYQQIETQAKGQSAAKEGDGNVAMQLRFSTAAVSLLGKSIARFCQMTGMQ